MSEQWQPPSGEQPAVPPQQPARSYPPQPHAAAPQPGPGAYPVGPPPAPGADPGGPPGYAYPVVDPQQNWGMAYPGHHPQAYGELVPRPPKPPVVGVATGLTWLGIALSGVLTIANGAWTWANREKLLADATRDAPTGVDLESTYTAAMTFALVLSGVMWLLPAAGAAVAAVLTGRGRNPARITLACLAGVFALVQFCGAGANLLVGTLAEATADAGPANPFGSAASQPGWYTAGQALLGALGVAILVLLLLPATNRYFSAGPGKRFAPEAATPA